MSGYCKPGQNLLETGTAFVTEIRSTLLHIGAGSTNWCIVMVVKMFESY